MVELECRRRGFQILGRNLHFRWGEIDLLAEKNGTLFLLEVRGRRGSRFLPSKMISWTKRKRLERLARVLVARHRKPIRTFLVEVKDWENEDPRIRWFEILVD